MRRRYRKNYKIYIILALVVVTTTFTIGYSEVTKVLRTNIGNTTIKNVNHEVHVISVTVLEKSTNSTCSNASFTATSVSGISATLSAKDTTPYCIYRIHMFNGFTNSGLWVDSKLSSISQTNPSGATTCTSSNNNATLVCDSIRYRLCEDSSCSTPLSTNFYVNKGSTAAYVYLKVDLASDPNTLDGFSQLGYGFNLTFTGY